MQHKKGNAEVAIGYKLRYSESDSGPEVRFWEVTPICFPPIPSDVLTGKQETIRQASSTVLSWPRLRGSEWESSFLNCQFGWLRGYREIVESKEFLGCGGLDLNQHSSGSIALTYSLAGAPLTARISTIWVTFL